MKGKNKLYSFFKLFGLAFKVCPAYVFLLLVNAAVSSFQIFANVILPRYLIDELVKGSLLDVKAVVIWGGAIVLSNLLFALLVKLFGWLLEVKKEYAEMHMMKALSQRIMSMDYANLENPYYLDLKERAVFAIRNQGILGQFVNQVAVMIQSLFTIAGLLVIMFSLSWVLVALLALCIALMLIVQALFSKEQIKLHAQMLPINRKYGYYFNSCYRNETQKDARLYDMSGMFADTITQYNLEVIVWLDKLVRKGGAVEGAQKIIAALQSALAYGYVGLRCLGVFGERVSIGSLTMYVNSAISFSSSVTTFGNSIISIDRNLSYLQPFVEILDLPDQSKGGGRTPFPKEIESIEFKEVTFSYPTGSAPVLQDISFKVEKGQKTSVVGLNGAGKTTLIKLLTRLYKPNGGEILINGVNIEDYDYTDYINNISAVFQDYKLFAFSIEENITCLKQGEERAEEIIEKVGLTEKISTLKSGVKSLYGKNLDEEGIELSGGEGQKIAIARALFKTSPIVILDEPTSALDPIAEAEIYQHFNSLVGGKTAFYISHRMSSSVFCDKVLIIEGGRVADYDTHKNLMKKKNSLYYKLFTTQAENYKL